MFSTIQAAIDAASDGDTIVVAAGTYAEQLVIDGKSNLTIEAAAGGNVTVEMVASPVFTATAAEANGRDRTAVVTIKDSAGITVHGIEVDGNGLANAMPGGTNPDFEGVLVLNSAATLDGITVVEVRDPLNPDGTPQGSQRGNAIVVLNTDGQEREVTVSDSVVHDFQKNGITVSGAGVTALVSGNEVVGAGFLPAPSTIAQNGIQISYGAAATVTDNHISEIGYQRGDYVTTGILAYQAADDITITHNTFVGATTDGLGVDYQPTTHVGIYVVGETDNAVVTDNTMDHLTFGVALANNTDDATLSGNTFANTFASVTTNTGSLDTWTGDNYEIYGGDNNSPLNFVGSSGIDYVEGTNFGDTINGAGGDDILSGGGGSDTAVFSGLHTAYNTSGLSVTAGEVAGTISGPDGTDTVSGVESLKFDDGYYVLNGMSIQAAINAASAGDTILIAAGTYTGTINVTQAVTLRGVDDDAGDGGNDVIITAPGVTAINIQADDVALANLTIRDSATGVHWNGPKIS